jgi:uncharacterized Fe-S cluster-containing MiaB family protein
MEAKKQTAVDFLIEVMQRRLPPFYAHFMMDMDSVYEQTKEMEKDQIIKAFNEGTFASDEKVTAEQYYNEIYGN